MRTLLLFLAFFLPISLQAADLGTESMGVLKAHCYSCHGATKHGDPKYDVTDYAYLVSNDTKLIVPGSVEDSRIMQRILAKEMPPKPKPPLPEKEIAVLEKWIKEGAKPPESALPRQIAPPRKFVTNDEVRGYVAQDAAKYGAVAINFRYLSLANLHNTGASDTLISENAAAVSKVLNSMSFNPQIVIPTRVGQDGLIIRIELNRYGFSAADWQRILDVYPYDGAPIFIRADWFVANVTKPPLYYDVLHLPNTLQEFEQRLGVNRERNFLFNTIARAGIIHSGVAFHNRVLERNFGLFGPYWISYDFASEQDDQNIVRNPLGPKFQGNPFDEVAFRHNANEIIATLPNGLDIYYVADAAGKRLDKAQEDIVADSSQITRSISIIPGLSCLTCHDQGKKTKMTDVVRNGSPVNGLEQLKVLAIYPPQKALTTIVERDRDNYVAAVKRAVSPLLAANSAVIEPIRPSVEEYNLPLDLNKAALEVGVTPDFLKRLIYGRGDLQQLGLRPLIDGQTITRDTWETTEFGVSPFQRILATIGQ